MTGIAAGVVRALLGAPVAALVAWLARYGVHVDGGVVEAAIAGAAVVAVTDVASWARNRWPTVGRALGWLIRRRYTPAPDR